MSTVEQRPPAAEMLAVLDDVIAQLNRPPTTELRAEGWTDEVQEDFLGYFALLRERLRRDERLDGRYANATMARWLDHCGIHGGRLLDRIAELEALVRESVQGPPPKEPWRQEPWLQWMRTTWEKRRQRAAVKRLMRTTRRDR